MQAYKESTDGGVAAFIATTNDLVAEWSTAATQIFDGSGFGDQKGAPAVIIDAYGKLRAAQLSMCDSLRHVVSYIELRAPVIKEEDNAGVAVQLAVKKAFEAAAASIYGTSKDDASFAATVKSLDDYLSARTTTEALFLKEKEPAAPSASVSLCQLDHAQVDKIRAGYATLARYRASLAVAFENNKYVRLSDLFYLSTRAVCTDYRVLLLCTPLCAHDCYSRGRTKIDTPRSEFAYS